MAAIVTGYVLVAVYEWTHFLIAHRLPTANGLLPLDPAKPPDFVAGAPYFDIPQES